MLSGVELLNCSQLMVIVRTLIELQSDESVCITRVFFYRIVLGATHIKLLRLKLDPFGSRILNCQETAMLNY